MRRDSKLLLAIVAFAVTFIVVWLTYDLWGRGTDGTPSRVGAPTTTSVSLVLPPSTTTTVAPPPTVASTTTAPKVRAASASPAVGPIPDIVRSAFARFGATVAEQAIRVASCESTGDVTGQHFDPGATGSQGEVGLMQIHPKYHSARAAKFGWTMHDLYDPAKNVVVAADLFAEKGWGPWTCRHAA